MLTDEFHAFLRATEKFCDGVTNQEISHAEAVTAIAGVLAAVCVASDIDPEVLVKPTREIMAEALKIVRAKRESRIA